MKYIIFLMVFMLFRLGAVAQSRWLFELHGAVLANVPLPLTIHQDGYPDIKISGARYHTEPFVMPVYYDGRISRWHDNKSWEIEFTHHKIYLQSPPPEVQKFNVSHGFNLLMGNRGFDRQIFRYRVGAGVVIAHPESEVRNLEFKSNRKDNDRGYYLTGPGLQASINKPFYLCNRFFINAEARTTLGYASVKIAQGHADVWNFTLHLMLGMGMVVKK